VTGTLHMGHAFNQTIMDSLTRYHRMKGYNTAWIPAPTTPASPPRSWWSASCRPRREPPRPGPRRVHQEGLGVEGKSGNTITTQMRRMGDTVDWSREYFTMDDKLSKVVTETFVKLYQQGLIYRGKRLVNWDPVLQSPCPTWKSRTRKKTARSGTSPTR
jgi:valyl-tRNA synthetase